MTTRVLLPLFALFSAFLPGCSSASSSADGRAWPAAGTANQDTSETANAQGGSGTGSAFAPVAGASAGYNPVAPGGGAGSSYSLGSAAPVTWNSAKSATIGDAQLQAEYSTWKAAHVEMCANGSAVVLDEGAVVSEGIAYGMLLSVAMADQALFDALWKFYQDHADKNGLMNWKTSKCEAPGNNNTNAATDADLDAAMALVQAASRWPNATAGYLSKAEAHASKIVQFETDMCDGRRILRPGDTFGGCSDENYKRINPSYFSPGYYKVFARYFSSQASTWLSLSDASYQLYAVYQARMKNLVPDWSAPDGSATVIDSDNQYWYDACRTPWRVAVDYAWTGDTRAKTFMQNISNWVDANGGLPKAAPQQNSAFVGAFALAGGYDQGKFDGYMNGWLGAELDDTPYYQGTLRMLYLLVAAGKFSSTL